MRVAKSDCRRRTVSTTTPMASRMAGTHATWSSNTNTGIATSVSAAITITLMLFARTRSHPVRLRAKISTIPHPAWNAPP